MFAEMRRKDRELSQEQVKAIIEKGEYGILSTTGVNGYPYGVPVNYAADEKNIYFHCALNEGSKVENMWNDPKVCFTIVGKTEVMPEKYGTKYESVILFGAVHELTGDDKRRGLDLIVDKYSAEFKAGSGKVIDSMIEKTAVYVIEIAHVTGKARRG